MTQRINTLQCTYIHVLSFGVPKAHVQPVTERLQLFFMSFGMQPTHRAISSYLRIHK